MTQEGWPSYEGDYVVGDPRSPVAVLIIGRGAVDLPSKLFCIKGIMKTENLGLEKVVMNVISNPGIRYLLVCGKEEFGHFPADAVLKLFEKGLDKDRRIIGAKGAIPYLCSLPQEAVERFRSQVQLVDLVHPKDVDEIVAMDPIYQFEAERIVELTAKLEELNASAVGRYPEEGLFLDLRNLRGTGDRIGKFMHKSADVFIEGMLSMPSEKLNTRTGLVVISDELGVAIDPVSGNTFFVPNVELAMRLKSYFTGY